MNTNKQYLPNFFPNHFFQKDKITSKQNINPRHNATIHSNPNSNSTPKLDVNSNCKTNINTLYKDHLADLLISCDGSCGSKLGLIFHSCKHVIQSGNYSQFPTDCKLCSKTKLSTQVNYVKIIQSYFWSYSDPHRQCLIENFEKFGCIEKHNTENGFKNIYNKLKDPSFYIQDLIWVKTLMSFFYDLLYFGFDAILNKLANLGCKSNALTVREEIQQAVCVGSDYQMAMDIKFLSSTNGKK